MDRSGSTPSRSRQALLQAALAALREYLVGVRSLSAVNDDSSLKEVPATYFFFLAANKWLRMFHSEF